MDGVRKPLWPNPEDITATNTNTVWMNAVIVWGLLVVVSIIYCCCKKKRSRGHSRPRTIFKRSRSASSTSLANNAVPYSNTAPAASTPNYDNVAAPATINIANETASNRPDSPNLAELGFNVVDLMDFDENTRSRR